METVRFSESLVSTYESVRRHNPEEQHGHLHHCEGSDVTLLDIPDMCKERLESCSYIYTGKHGKNAGTG